MVFGNLETRNANESRYHRAISKRLRPLLGTSVLSKPKSNQIFYQDKKMNTPLMFKIPKPYMNVSYTGSNSGTYKITIL